MLYFDKKTISIASVYLVGISLALVLFSFFLSSLCLIIAFILSLLVFDKNKLTKARMLFCVVTGIPFFLFLFSGLFSFYQEGAISMISKRLPLLLIPMTFINIDRVRNKDVTNIIILFGTACSIISFQGIINGVLFYNETGRFFESNYVSHLFTVQHVYLATYIVFVLIASFFIYKSINKKMRVLLLVINGINLLAFVFLSSKISLVILLAMGLLYLFNSRKNTKTKLSFMLLIAFLLICMTVFKPYRQRIEQLFDGKDPRTEIWHCAWQAIGSKSYFGFIPLGDFQETLNYCYYQNTNKLDLEGYSTHSQYLEFWVVSGIIGMLLYIFSLLYLFRFALINNNILFQCFVLLFFIFGFTECALSRQYGIMFFATMVSLLAYSENPEFNFLKTD